ncbi:MAG: radical SAM protein [Thermodesulfobacteriota bacterium]
MTPLSPHDRKTVSFSRDTVNVFFHILTRCNLACAHCYINPAQHGGNTLALDTICRWLDAFEPAGRRANLVLLGGEPTLHPDLAAAAAHARKIGYDSITIDTNGYLFCDILNKTGPDVVDYISFSLDGAVAETNDALRGKGSYEACLSGIRRANERGFATSLIYTVGAANLHELPAMAELAGRLGISRMFIQVLGLRGKSAAGRQGAFAPAQAARKQWLEMVPAAARAVADQGIIVTYPKVFLDDGEAFECAGRVADNYFVFPNGRVYRCPLCEDFPIHSLAFENDRLVATPRINEADLFELDIPEGCVMNRLVQPGNLSCRPDGRPAWRIACCMLKEEITPNIS